MNGAIAGYNARMKVLPGLSLPAGAPSLCHWHGLHGSAGALALSEAVAADQRAWVYVAADARELERMASELRFFAADAFEILTLPDWEVLPYDVFSPHPDIVSGRLSTLARLPDLKHGVLLLTVEGLLSRLPPVDYVGARTFELRRGAQLAVDPLRLRLSSGGYASVGQVSAPGEYALRGSLFDVWPMGAQTPLRVDLFDDCIDSIRCFDAETQRSLEVIEEFRLLPAREFPLDANAVRDFRQRFRARFQGDLTRMPVYRGVTEGLAPPGIEFYLPLFFDQTASLFDYLPADAVMATTADLPTALQSAWDSIGVRFEDRAHDIERPLLPPAEAFIEPQQIQHSYAAHARVQLQPFRAVPGSTEAGDYDAGSHKPPDFHLDTRAAQPLAPLLDYLSGHAARVLIAADSAGRREVIAQMLSAHGKPPRPVADWATFRDGSARLAITVAEDLAGVALDDPPLLVLGEAQLFGARVQQARRRRRVQADPAAILRDLQNLEIGAPVVHEVYGVGRYLGLQVMSVGGDTGEFLQIEYRGGDRIYVPVHALHLVGRYTGGAPETAPLHKLGTDQWSKAKSRAAEAVRDVAAELLDLHARRQARRTAPLVTGELEYQSFANAFRFEETPDQAEAIAQVVADLGKETPMDRIVCGDVGFGKTEVAMRAAFVATAAGHQVAVLVPTTLLAEQHAQSFRDRFADWPVRIEALSRFRSSKESNAVLEGLENGSVDIVVATHRLLHAHPRFKRLGLVIVDEEHRFGVRDKEQLKTLRAEVHVLTLTATPIPRTLNMALGGLRELSLISTPPVARTAIKTFVTEWHGPTLREAALRELRRGGQIYLMHNEVQDIEKVAAEFQRLVPEAEVRVGHGQMRERELEQLMVDFSHRRFNTLVCTTIIESGIDVPTANTIIIDRADRLGLAQLHQLRGRVGRSHHRAYAYLLVPNRKSLTADAAKRLEAIESMEELGAGFMLATHDLEIRGAGEFLGERQSGELAEVGLAMYLDMLERCVNRLRADGGAAAAEIPLAAVSEVELHVPALLPPDYVPDMHLRLALYQRIVGADVSQLHDLATELVDRFGPLPEPGNHLLQLAHLRLSARALGVRRLELGPEGGSILFEAQNRVEPTTVLRLIQREPHTYRLEGSLKLRVNHDIETPAERFTFAQQLLERLRQPDTPTPPVTPGQRRPDKLRK
jgi:transcription-repair coupling factor (superfamily II helicase)